METDLGERVIKEEKFGQNRKPSLIGVSGGRNRTVGCGRGGRSKNTDYASNCSYRPRSGSDAPVHHHTVGPGREAWVVSNTLWLEPGFSALRTV